MSIGFKRESGNSADHLPRWPQIGAPGSPTSTEIHDIFPMPKMTKHGCDCPRCKTHNLVKAAEGESFLPVCCIGCGNVFLYFPPTGGVADFGGAAQ